ncbi:unnamed protein product [Bursaphelenchus xylophilus]|uniref:(pine wood nematode) hypothetical protein n=1 Tax=Bursaphelenchus xylophilus TaxID=6326 RepID=A0A1I7S7F2_BURXY|nr:unnamed protein product [Bursaphelenchus xylophilus]CAG9085023.1 unnamed protein product [Bursaphelenchus xylophilus]
MAKKDLSDHVIYGEDVPNDSDSNSVLLNSFGPPKKSRTAHYNDDIRLCIIEEVYRQPLLWAATSGEPVTMLHRRRAYNEIASKIGNQENGLKAVDVERQWKNLKDTYIKLKKKVITDDDGTLLIPKWKFFRCLAFIDNEDLECFNIEEEIKLARREHGIEAKGPVNTSTPQTSSNKNTNSGNGSNVVEVITVGRPKKRVRVDQDVSRISNDHQTVVMTPTSSKRQKEDEEADEYIAFCNSLIHPLREIGAYSKLEYYKFQKMIRDALFDVQMQIHTSKPS